MLRWLRFCLALSLLLFPLSVAAAGSDEKEPAIVLKLPSSMTAEEIGRLLGDLKAKGATAVPSNPAEPVAEPALAPQIWANLRRALPKTPSLLNLPEAWRSALAADGGSDEGFWFELCCVLAAALAAEGLDLGIVYLPPPHDPTVLEPLAEAIRDSGLLT